MNFFRGILIAGRRKARRFAGNATSEDLTDEGASALTDESGNNLTGSGS